MQVIDTTIPEIRVLVPEKFGDARGFFSETYNHRTLASVGIELDFVQDNQAFSVARGIVRGLHYQLPPMAQDKLVRVLRGAIFDVTVDIRSASPTFGQHVAMVLDAAGAKQLFIPAGFAHGYCTIEPNTEVFYKTSNYYSPEHERTILWNDPAIGIDWPINAEDALLSEKDSRAPRLAEVTDLF
jgi:dTDP-4-dehydrorhamnose 3,5-epimerase